MTQSAWSANPKRFAIWPFIVKVCQHLHVFKVSSFWNQSTQVQVKDLTLTSYITTNRPGKSLRLIFLKWKLGLWYLLHWDLEGMA